MQNYYEAELKRKTLPLIYELFSKLDHDGDGVLTLEEFMSNKEMHDRLRSLVKLDDIAELFDILDKDGSGRIDLDEFFNGLSKLVNTNTAVEIIRIASKIDGVRAIQQKTYTEIRDISRRFSSLQSRGLGRPSSDPNEKQLYF